MSPSEDGLVQSATCQPIGVEAKSLIRWFRALLLVSLFTALLSFFEPWLFDRWLSEDSLNLLAWSGYNSILEFPNSIWWLMMLVVVAARCGLWFFSPSARAVFLIFSIFYCVLFALTGIQVFTPFIGALGTVGCLADGAIIALAYSPQLKNEFR